jgi:quercetin dioxygenase-like cupin family protein
MQLIYCYRGWVRLVYEDQGEPFVMRAGDCVLQPPQIRHRVLESSDGLEVIEIGSPAEHMTRLDHQMTLPTGHQRPTRDFGGQRFAFHQAEHAEWLTDAGTGTQIRDLGIAAATDGLASAQVVRLAGQSSSRAGMTIQNKTFAFAFVLEGAMRLQVDQRAAMMLRAGDAFVIPHGMSQCVRDRSVDWQLLQVFLPG